MRHQSSGGKLKAMFAAVTPCTSDDLNGMDYNTQGDCRESNDNFQKYDSYIWGGYMSPVKISWEFYATTKLGQQHWPPVYGCSLYSVFIQVQALLYLTSEIRRKIFHSYDAALQRLIGCLLRTEIHTKTTANERERTGTSIALRHMASAREGRFLFLTPMKSWLSYHESTSCLTKGETDSSGRQ